MKRQCIYFSWRVCGWQRLAGGNVCRRWGVWNPGPSGWDTTTLTTGVVNSGKKHPKHKLDFSGSHTATRRMNRTIVWIKRYFQIKEGGGGTQTKYYPFGLHIVPVGDKNESPKSAGALLERFWDFWLRWRRFWGYFSNSLQKVSVGDDLRYDVLFWWAYVWCFTTCRKVNIWSKQPQPNRLESCTNHSRSLDNRREIMPVCYLNSMVVKLIRPCFLRVDQSQTQINPSGIVLFLMTIGREYSETGTLHPPGLL